MNAELKELWNTIDKRIVDAAKKFIQNFKDHPEDARRAKVESWGLEEWKRDLERIVKTPINQMMGDASFVINRGVDQYRARDMAKIMGKISVFYQPLVWEKAS
uniref:Uncharacterized protein n=1 Tax=uncultured Parcubacteria group bacterium TaxID=221218 RepID=A0A1L3KS55_9BACT|nr:hypothetical protein [uncultured Parcubacteria group bacterium]